jgi:general stress protein 26
MDIQPQASPEMTRLGELIGESRIGMLTTVEPDGTLRSRPLATLQMDSEGRLWFFTSISSPKVAEIDQHRFVNVSYANPARNDYVSISGTTQILRDRPRMEELWTPWVKPWFPNGLEDQDLALLCVTIQAAEYWDSPGGTVRQFISLAKATQGDTEALGDHAKVDPTRGRPRPQA